MNQRLEEDNRLYCKDTGCCAMGINMPKYTLNVKLKEKEMSEKLEKELNTFLQSEESNEQLLGGFVPSGFSPITSKSQAAIAQHFYNLALDDVKKEVERLKTEHIEEENAIDSECEGYYKILDFIEKQEV